MLLNSIAFDLRPSPAASALPSLAAVLITVIGFMALYTFSPGVISTCFLFSFESPK